MKLVAEDVGVHYDIFIPEHLFIKLLCLAHAKGITSSRMLRQSVIKNDVKCFSKNTRMSPQCHLVSPDESLIYQAFGIFCKKNVTFAAIVSGEAFAE